MGGRDIARRLVPFAIRLELLRLKRLPGWLLETPTISRRRAEGGETAEFPYLLAEHASPLVRSTGSVAPALQRGKERNVALAASLIDRLVVEPNKLFSYHRTVGRPLLYHNRLSPTEVSALFEQAGFELVAVRRLILPDRRYVEGDQVLMGRAGISRRWIRGGSRSISEQDLRTAAAHYLFRKPG